ncbi:Putative sensory transduction regulator [Friedmanniella luteola]|uniref:Putative sensory transduction regulator n=1 Tax=Friedmanniella luteola TaxID=546871 RepID=A0A1H1ZIM2_9ACTN|nr:YbjN domain-containing protein [Friedmanniella luteola]SDT33489.1 Putative sensory transduction regulator [Friedmanniella luteola]
MDVRTSTQRRWLRSHLSTLLATITGEPVTADGDGDFPVRGLTSQAWVRPRTGDPWGVQVFATAARDVPARVAVLREINEQNAAHLGTRVYWVEGLVVVDCFVFADAVTEETLTAVVGRVLHLADSIGPVLTALHGGTTFHSASSASAA